MTRRRFGGGIADWAFNLTAQNVPVLVPGATITFWTASSGGTQYTDLAAAIDGSGAISQVSAGIGVTAGQIPAFYGPDEVAWMWASANSGPRVLMECNDGSAGAAMLAGAQTFTGTKTYGPNGADSSKLLLYAEATGQTTDLAAAFSGTDTGEGATRQRGFYINSKGELRVNAVAAASVPVKIKGQVSQSAHLFDLTNSSDTVLAWAEPNGSVRAPNLGAVLAWSVSGAVTVRTGALRIYNDTGVTQTIRAVRATVGTAPTGQAIRVDINKNGTTIFTTQGNRPNIPISGNSSKVTIMDVTTFADGDFLTFDIDQVGSTVAGSDLQVQVLVY